MNPFSYGTIVKDEQFFDRKKESKRIIDTLAGGNNMVLYAPRRFGKTSLVHRVMEQLERKGFLCIYFDFLPVFSVASFVRLYSKALSAKQSNLSKFAQTFATVIRHLRPVVGFSADGQPEFRLDVIDADINEEAVAQLLDMPEQLAGSDRHVLVFFDEFQEAGKLSSIRFDSLLRSKIQQQKRTHYLFLGSKTHLLHDMFDNKKRAFYNSATQMTIGALPEKDTISFLQQRFSESNITLDDDTARYIITTASAIPHYVQLLAAEIWQYAVNTCKRITCDIVDACTQSVLAGKSDYYMELYDRQSKSQKQLLQALTVGGKNIFSVGYIYKHHLPSVSTLQRAVRDLINNGIVEKTGNEHFIADPFFKLFVKQFAC